MALSTYLDSGETTPTRSPRTSATPDYRFFLHDMDERSHGKFELVSISGRAMDCIGQEQYVLLLTPIVASTGKSRQDPFEVLGRKLSKKHNRIRHVPYLSNHLTTTHYAFAQEAGAVVLVSFEAEAVKSFGPSRSQKSMVHLRFTQHHETRADSPHGKEAIFPTEHDFDEAVKILYDS